MAELVECRSDDSYAQRPVALNLNEQRLEIVEIIAQWRTPDGKYFRVRTSDGQIFELSYFEANHEWQLHQP